MVGVPPQGVVGGGRGTTLAGRLPPVRPTTTHRKPYMERWGALASETMPGTVICSKCGQRKKSERHHCTPSAVEKQKRIREQFGELPSDLGYTEDEEE